MSDPRPHDLVLFGATGFTGQLVAEVLRDRAVGTDLRWAIAGRNRPKLEALARRLGIAGPPILIGDALERSEMDRIARSSRVVCSTAGPYARFGSELVAACAEAGTHYCDLSGEVPWIRRMIDAHDDTARRTGSRIVPSCGFDSVPSDLGVFFLQREVLSRFGTPSPRIHGGVVRASGGVSGGTVQSALDLFEPSVAGASPLAVGRDPNALVPHARSMGDDVPERFFPHWDALAQTWTAPWPMSLVNARVVRRSAALCPEVYGEGFRYEESLWLGADPIGAVKAAGVGLGLIGAAGVLAIPPVRRWAATVLPQPGEGPAKSKRDAGFWEMRFVAAAPHGGGATVRATVSADEDPGYGSTARMLAECALSLTDRGAPERGGVLTPAAAFGSDLIGRLRLHAGIRFGVS